MLPTSTRRSDATRAAVWCWCVAAALAVRPPPVTVNKCCALNETLQPDGACEPGAPELWAPLVYAPQRRVYLTRGSIPPHWQVLSAQRPPCLTPRLLRSKPLSAFLLFANGSLYLRERDALLPPTSYCADVDVALACDPDAGEAPLTLPLKCCGDRYAYSERNGTCARGTEEDAELLVRELGGDPSRRFGVGFPACDNATVGATSAGGARLLADGSLRLHGGTKLPAGGYCVDWRAGRANATVAVACAGLLGQGARDLRFTLYPVGLLVSAVFLAATLAAGFALPSAHHALHWRCQTNYVATLLAGDVLLAATQLATSVPPALCVSLAALMHFLFLSAFFWLNTMCFNIWWTFRDFRPTSAEKSQEWCRLRVYRVYAWGGPLLIAGLALLLDRLPDNPAYTFLRPRFATRHCWFFGDMEILAFFFGPVGVLLLVNLALFVSTARQLTCGLWRRDELKSTTERAALGRVCAKLVVVMGVTWAADVVSWAAGGPHELWYLTDLVNALQGVFIFIVVGCQPQVWSAVRRGWRWTRGAHAGGAVAAPLHSSSQLPSCGDSLTHTTLANSSQPAPCSQPAPQPASPRETLC